MRGMHALSQSIFFIFMQFSVKTMPKNRIMPPLGLAPLWEILDPPLLWEIVDLPLNNEQLNRLVKIMFQDISENFRNIHQSFADLGGGVRDARPPWASKFFRFHAVFGKIWRVHAPPGGFTPPLGKILDPPLPITVEAQK